MQVGDFIVYPGQGVGHITAIEERFIADTPCAFFNVRILETQDQILIPVERAADCGARSLVSTDSASAVVQIFSEPPSDWTGVSWIRRSRHYGSSLMAGELQGTAEVLRDLLHMRQCGPLSFGQLKLLQRSRRMVTHELAIALERDVRELREQIENAVARVLGQRAA